MQSTQSKPPVNAAKEVLARNLKQERRRFDSADWALSLSFNKAGMQPDAEHDPLEDDEALNATQVTFLRSWRKGRHFDSADYQMEAQLHHKVY